MALPYLSHWAFYVVGRAPRKGTDRGTGGPLPLLQAQVFWGRGLRPSWGETQIWGSPNPAGTQ